MAIARKTICAAIATATIEWGAIGFRPVFLLTSPVIHPHHLMADGPVGAVFCERLCHDLILDIIASTLYIASMQWSVGNPQH
ncbi:hypothetical protein V1291_004809 [Nitrobacteraceae bacterium AZCC 1564]